MTTQTSNTMAIAKKLVQPLLWLGVAPLLPLIGVMWLFSKIESEEQPEIVNVEKPQPRSTLPKRPRSGVFFTLEVSQ